MKKLFTTILFFCSFFFSIAQITVRMKSGNYVNNELAKNTTNSKEYYKPLLYEGKYYLWLQFSTMPTDKEKASLQGMGFEFFDYLPDNTFVAAIPENTDFAKLIPLGVFSAMKPLA